MNKQEKTREKELKKNCIWFPSAEEATQFFTKIHGLSLNLLCYVEYTTVICNRDFTKKEYKLLFPCKD